MGNFNPPDNLSDVERKLLIAIRDASPQWLNRSQIAACIGNKQLNAYGIQRLEILIARGFIEMRRPRWVTGIEKRIEYRAVVEVED